MRRGKEKPWHTLPRSISSSLEKPPVFKCLYKNKKALLFNPVRGNLYQAPCRSIWCQPEHQYVTWRWFHWRLHTGWSYCPKKHCLVGAKEKYFNLKWKHIGFWVEPSETGKFKVLRISRGFSVSGKITETFIKVTKSPVWNNTIREWTQAGLRASSQGALWIEKNITRLITNCCRLLKREPRKDRHTTSLAREISLRATDCHTHSRMFYVLEFLLHPRYAPLQSSECSVIPS